MLEREVNKFDIFDSPGLNIAVFTSINVQTVVHVADSVRRYHQECDPRGFQYSQLPS